MLVALCLPKNRVAVPISDDEVNVTFYTVCKRENLDLWKMLWDEMKKAS